MVFILLISYNSPRFGALARAEKYCGKETATKIAQEILLPTYQEYERERYGRTEYSLAMEEAMKSSEANQPLCILVAEKAEQLGIPFVFATSSYHHDDLTQLICEYQRKRKWPEIIDCGHGDEKKTPQFWERPFRILRGK